MRRRGGVLAATTLSLMCAVAVCGAGGGELSTVVDLNAETFAVETEHGDWLLMFTGTALQKHRRSVVVAAQPTSPRHGARRFPPAMSERGVILCDVKAL